MVGKAGRSKCSWGFANQRRRELRSNKRFQSSPRQDSIPFCIVSEDHLSWLDLKGEIPGQWWPFSPFVRPLRLVLGSCLSDTETDERPQAPRRSVPRLVSTDCTGLSVKLGLTVRWWNGTKGKLCPRQVEWEQLLAVGSRERLRGSSPTTGTHDITLVINSSHSPSVGAAWPCLDTSDQTIDTKETKANTPSLGRGQQRGTRGQWWLGSCRLPC